MAPLVWVTSNVEPSFTLDVGSRYLEIRRTAKIHFTTKNHLPTDFCHNSFTYFACPTCVKAHEIRYCDGTTKITHQFCDQHKRAVEQAGTAKEDQLAMLDFLSRCIKAGAFPQPQLSGSLDSEQAHLWPTTEITYQHLNCIHSATPQCILISASQLAAQDHEARIVLDALKHTANGMQLPSGSMDAEILRMEEDLLASKIAKAVFLRRCNGEYVNALGRVLRGAGRGRRPLGVMGEGGGGQQGGWARIGGMSGQTLARREEMCRIGSVEVADVAVTCWLMQRKSPLDKNVDAETVEPIS